MTPITENSTIWIVAGLAVLAVIVALSLLFARKNRLNSRVLRERFGPEYDRAIAQYGGRRGERVLASRLERVEKIDFRELSDGDRQRFTSSWTMIQAQFIDDPRAAVGRANDLIKEVMRARGYHADDGFEQRAADLSVDHPEVVEHYREARRLAQTSTDPKVSTEQLRQAVVHYRVLFADLLQPAQVDVPGALRPAHA